MTRYSAVSNNFSETTGPIEAKFHMEPPWIIKQNFIMPPTLNKLVGHIAFGLCARS